MKSAHFTAGLGFSIMVQAGLACAADETTDIRNGLNRATIKQSGDPSKRRLSIETGPGYTRIEQHDRSNSAVIIQNGDPGGVDPIPSDPD